jgi:parvulin-like peptidyl-prolyl isomerase
MAKQTSASKIVTKKHIARLERERRQNRLILTIGIGGILLVAGLLVYGYLKLNVFAAREPVAEVNGVKITTEQWQERVRLQRVNLLNLYDTYTFYQQNFGMDTSQQQQQILFTLQSPETLGEQVLDQMADEILIREEAEKLGITVSEEEVEAAIQESYNFFPDGTPTPTITPTEFSTPTMSSEQLTIYPSTPTSTEAPTSTAEPSATPDLSATATATAADAPATPTTVPEAATGTATPFTLEGFQSQYEEALTNFETTGISEETLRSVYEARLLRERLLDEIAKDTPHTDEQVWARHILLESETEARVAYSLLSQGADFAQMAKQSSADTGSGANGGDLGWFGKGAMVAEFEEAAFSQEIGAVGEPVQSQFGYHIIQVIDRQERPLDASAYQQKRETEFTDWLTSIREGATITKYDIWKERVPTEPALPAQQ